MYILKVVKMITVESKISKLGKPYSAYNLLVDSPFFSDTGAVVPSSRTVFASSRIELPNDDRVRLVYVSAKRQGNIWLNGLAS